jgi:hypothetical protein
MLLFKHLFSFVFILFQSIVGHKKLPRGPPVWHPWTEELPGTYMTPQEEIVERQIE